MHLRMMCLATKATLIHYIDGKSHAKLAIGMLCVALIELFDLNELLTSSVFYLPTYLLACLHKIWIIIWVQTFHTTKAINAD